MKKIIFSQKNFRELKEIILKNKKLISINFFNGVDINAYSKMKEFRDCLENKKIINLNNIDGISVALPLSIKKHRKIKRLQGPTFTDKFLKDKELNENRRHFFLGIDKNELSRVLERYPNLKAKDISGYNLPFVKGLYFPNDEIEKTASLINKSGADYLWIGMGSPKQQILTNDLVNRIKVKNIFNVGVALEFIKGTKKRAPKIFQNTGLEWLYRLLFSQFKLTSGRLIPSFKGMIKSFYLSDIE